MVNIMKEVENSEETHATNTVQNKEKQFDFSKEFNPKSAQKILQSLEEKTRGQNHVIGNLDLKALPKLSDMYLQNNPFLRNLHSSLSSTLLSEPGQDSNIDVIQVMILLYMRVNLFDKIDYFLICFMFFRLMVAMATLHTPAWHIMVSVTQMPAPWMKSI